MTSAGRVAFGWVTAICVIIVLAILSISVNPQVEIWQQILVTYNIHPDVGDFLIGCYRLALVIVSIGIIIWATINTLADESDTFEAWEKGY